MKGVKLIHIIFVFAILFRIILFNIIPVTGDATFHYPIIEYMGDNFSMPIFEYVTGPNPFWYPPFYHIIGAIIYSVFGKAEYTPLFIGVTGLFVFYFFVKKHYPKHAVSATALLAVLPFHSYYSAIGYPDGLLFILAIASFHFYKNYLIVGDKRNLFYTACFCALSASTHYHGFAPLAAIAIHLGLKNPKHALIFIVIASTLSSPWYIRNTYIFGNPIWPKIFGGYFPDDGAVQSMPKTLDGLFGLHKWQALFFDFWIGAPNSGDDIMEKLYLANEKTKFAYPLAVLWLCAMILVTVLSVRGVKKIGSSLWIITFIICLIPFSGNGLARMFTAFTPFIIIALAKGYESLRFSGKNVLAIILAIALISGPVGYGMGYNSYRQKYTPIFDAIRLGTEPAETIVMPFNIGDCIYQTKRKCLRIGSIGGIPNPSEGKVRDILKQGGVDKVCCTSLSVGEMSATDKLICNGFMNKTPIIDFNKNGVWGKCWNIME